MKNLFLGVAILLSVICYAQDHPKGLGLGLDLTMHNLSNQYYNDLSPQYLDTLFPALNSIVLQSSLLNISYAFTSNSVIGIFGGIGVGKKSIKLDENYSVEDVRANTWDLGFFYKKIFMISHKIGIYIEPNIGYRSTASDGAYYCQKNNGEGGAVRYETKIGSCLLNLKTGIDFKLTKKLNLGVFISNDLMTYDNYSVWGSFPSLNNNYQHFIDAQHKNNWIFLNRYLIYGISLHYKFRA